MQTQSHTLPYPKLNDPDYLGLLNWVFQASHRAGVAYHVGQIAVDQSESVTVRSLGEYAQVMAGFGVVALVQRRVAPSVYAYLAIRTERPVAAIPKAVALREVTARQWLAAHAVRDRLPHVSAKRAIRDRLSCSEQESGAIMADLLMLNVLQDGRPITLTPYGMAMTL